jgi:hypothetical protein
LSLHVLLLELFFRIVDSHAVFPSRRPNIPEPPVPSFDC